MTHFEALIVHHRPPSFSSVAAHLFNPIIVQELQLNFPFWLEKALSCSERSEHIIWGLVAT
jgi:hypothetical protein